MSDKKTWNAKKEYFGACFLAILTVVMGLAAPSEGVSDGLVLVGVLAVLIVVGFYFQVGRQSAKSEEEEIRPSDSRLRRMALLWYVLSIVLAANLVRGSASEVIQGRGQYVTSVEWILGVVGAFVILLAGWRLYYTLRR